MACFLSTGLLCALASRLVSMFPLRRILNERHKATTLQRRYVHKHGDKLGILHNLPPFGRV